ncbi:MAG: hypothetical protein QW761_02130, partial [Candidatus Aenigmatarchaeota archaeon]
MSKLLPLLVLLVFVATATPSYAVTFELPERTFSLGNWYTTSSDYCSISGDICWEARYLNGRAYYGQSWHIFYRILIAPNGSSFLLDRWKFDGHQDTSHTGVAGYPSLTYHTAERKIPSLQIEINESGKWTVELRHIVIPTPTAERYPTADWNSSVELWTASEGMYQLNVWSPWVTSEYQLCTNTTDQDYAAGQLYLESVMTLFADFYGNWRSDSCVAHGMRPAFQLNCSYASAVRRTGYHFSVTERYCWFQRKEQTVLLANISQLIESYELTVSEPITISDVRLCADESCTKLAMLTANLPVWISVNVSNSDRYVVLYDINGTLEEGGTSFLWQPSAGTYTLNITALDLETGAADSWTADVTIAAAAPALLPFNFAPGGAEPETSASSLPAPAAAAASALIGGAGVTYALWRGLPKLKKEYTDSDMGRPFLPGAIGETPRRTDLMRPAIERPDTMRPAVMSNRLAVSAVGSAGSARPGTTVRGAGQAPRPLVSRMTVRRTTYGSALDAKTAADKSAFEKTKHEYEVWLAWRERVNALLASAQAARSVEEIDALMASGLLSPADRATLQARREQIVAQTQQAAALQCEISSELQKIRSAGDAGSVAWLTERFLNRYGNVVSPELKQELHRLWGEADGAYRADWTARTAAERQW